MQSILVMRIRGVTNVMLWVTLEPIVKMKANFATTVSSLIII